MPSQGSKSQRDIIKNLRLKRHGLESGVCFTPHREPTGSLKEYMDQEYSKPRIISVGPYSSLSMKKTHFFPHWFDSIFRE
jgi:hypothetical protein